MQRECYGSLHNDKELIHDQISVLKNLKNAPYLQEDFPKIPFCDFKSIVKHVSKERLKKKSDLKWKKFLAHKAERKVSDTFQDQSIELNNIDFEDSLGPVKNVNFQLETTPNVLLGRKGFGKSDLYFILKHVKRERKKFQDEEHWRNFNKLITETEQKLHEDGNKLCEYYKPKNVLGKLYHTSHGVDKMCSPILLEAESEASYHASKEETNVEIQNVKKKLNDLRKEIEPLLKNINSLFTACLNSNGDNSEEMKKQASEFTSNFERDFLSNLDYQLKHLRSLNSNEWGTSTFIENAIGIFQILLHALQVIERQLKVNSYIEPLKEMLSLFLNLSYSLVILAKYFIGDYGNQTENMENLILQTLSLLYISSSFQKGEIKITEKCLSSKKSYPEIHSPSLRWIDKSEALAFIKFGPPNKTKDHLNNNNDKETVKQTLNEETLAKPPCTR